MDRQIDKMVEGMVAAGMPRTQAVAIALSIEHSLESKSFQALYGTFLVNALQDFVDDFK